MHHSKKMGSLLSDTMMFPSRCKSREIIQKKNPKEKIQLKKERGKCKKPCTPFRAFSFFFISLVPYRCATLFLTIPPFHSNFFLYKKREKN